MPRSATARVATVCIVFAFAVALDAAAAPEVGARSVTLRVATDTQFESAALALRATGGTIVLRPRLYRQLVIRWRTGKPLRIVGTRGVRVERVVFDEASRVWFGHVTVGPIHGERRVHPRGVPR